MGKVGGSASLRGSVCGERTWVACAIGINTVSPHQCVSGALVCLKVAFSSAVRTQGFLSRCAFVFKPSIYFYLFIYIVLFCFVFFGLGQRISVLSFRVAPGFFHRIRRIRKKAFIMMKMHAAKLISLEM